MAYPIAGADVIQIRPNYSYGGQRYMNVLHYIIDDPGTMPAQGDTTLNDLLSAWRADNETQLLDCLATNCRFEYVDIQKIYPIRYRALRQSVSANGTSAGGAAKTGNVGSTITMRVDLATRNAGGSVHIPALPDAYMALGLLDPLQINNLDSYASSLISGLLGALTNAQATYAIAQVRTLPAVINPVTAYVSQLEARVMRRRTIGVGQ